jgi:hypothetical protein
MMDKRWLALVAILVFVVSAWACGSSDREPTERPEPASTKPYLEATAIPTETQEVEPTAGPEAEPTEEPKPRPAETYLGDVVEAHGMLLAALTVEDPTTPGMLYEATEGKKLVAVEIIVGNLSDEPLSVNPLNATLLDSEGFVYEPELGGREGGLQLTALALSYGEKVRGWIAFELPDGAIAASIKLAVSIFGDDFVRASLAPPPAGHEAYTAPLSILPPPPSIGLGATHEEYGYSLSASALEDPCTSTMFYEPTAGLKLVAVEIIVGNVSGETLSLNPLNAVLVDDRGFVYQLKLGSREGQLATFDLEVGEKAQGWVAFEVPEPATPASVKYFVSLFEEEYLQVGLVE